MASLFEPQTPQTILGTPWEPRPPRCLPDASKMPPRCLLDASPFHDSFSMISLPMIPPPWLLVIDISCMILQVGLQRNSVWGLALGSFNVACSLHRECSTGKTCGRCIAENSRGTGYAYRFEEPPPICQEVAKCWGPPRLAPCRYPFTPFLCCLLRQPSTKP